MMSLVIDWGMDLLAEHKSVPTYCCECMQNENMIIMQLETIRLISLVVCMMMIRTAIFITHCSKTLDEYANIS